MNGLAAGSVLLLMPFALAACGDGSDAKPASIPAASVAGSPAPASTAGASRTFDEQKIRTVTLFAETAGHVEAAADNAAAQRWDLARAHALGHVVENWDALRIRIDEESATAAGAAIDGLKRAVEQQGDVASAAADAKAALSEAMARVAGADWNDHAFRAQVVRELVETVEYEYEEAVEGGAIKLLIEYQDARAFLGFARKTYEGIAGSARTASGEAANEIEHEFEELGEAFDAGAPAQPPIELTEVEEAVGEIRAELARAFDIRVGEAAGPKALVTEINDGIEEALEVYEKGETDEAYELAAAAYLEGFENLEGDLIAKGRRDLVEDLELKLKALRDGIKEGRPAAELKALAEAIENRLDEVLAVIGES